MMAALTASPHDALPPSWDETIVPSLRKRLESESLILTKRLSTISVADDGQSSKPPQSNRRTESPPESHGDPSSASGSQLHRPSAIPRPGFSRNGDRGAASSPPAAEVARKPKRKRTHSTPFPFDQDSSSSSLPNGAPVNGKRSVSSSESTSPHVQSPPLGRTTPTPSRIPTVTSRIRSGSQSTQPLSSLPSSKASLPPSHRLSPSETTSADSEAHSHSIHVNGSSSSITRQRIVDERPPFTNDPSPAALESEFTDRPSSDEERPFQHWYRGDVSRNGGVGEYRVGKRMEMLDIANFGHPLREPRGRTRPYEDPVPYSEKLSFTPRKRGESVSSRERASIYIDPQDETVTGRVLDETPLTDVETEELEFEQDSQHFSPPGFEAQPNVVQNSPGSDRTPVASPPSTVSNRAAPLKSQTRIPQMQTRVNNSKLPTAVSTRTTSEPSSPAKSSHPERGRAHGSTNSLSKAAPKAMVKKRSKSAVDALRVSTNPRDSAEYAGLVDAVPETRSPLPPDGNWDEVILPTVARRMGIKYESEEPVRAVKKNAGQSSIAPPAPGTFGYDYTKYKPPRLDEEIPMGEFGQRHAVEPDDKEEPDLVPIVEKRLEDPVLRALRPKRDTMPSPAPFSHYMAELPSSPAVHKQTDAVANRQKEPHILVSPPALKSGNEQPSRVQEEEDAGCCKCVVM